MRAVTLAICAFLSCDLFVTWIENGAEEKSQYVFFGWMSVAVLFGSRSHSRDLSVPALFACLLGEILKVNCLQHVGFVLSLSGIIQPTKGAGVWIASSVLWMPVSGLVLHSINSNEHAFFRTALSISVLSWVVVTNAVELLHRPGNDRSDKSIHEMIP